MHGISKWDVILMFPNNAIRLTFVILMLGLVFSVSDTHLRIHTHTYVIRIHTHVRREPHCFFVSRLDKLKVFPDTSLPEAVALCCHEGIETMDSAVNCLLGQL